MELKMGNRRLKMIDGKAHIVKFSGLGIEIKSGRFTPINFSTKSDGYKQCSITIDGRNTKLFEHRLIWKLAHPDWDIFDSSRDNLIDHINRKKDDNCIDNLHVVNHQQNTFNTDAKGYYWNKICNKWQAKITLNGKAIYLGLFETEDEAHKAYLDAKPRYHVIAAPPIPGPVSPTD